MSSDVREDVQRCPVRITGQEHEKTYRAGASQGSEYRSFL
jgi:hypothetical protein